MTDAELVAFTTHLRPLLVQGIREYVDDDGALEAILEDAQAADAALDAGRLPFGQCAALVRRIRLAVAATVSCPASARRAAALREMEDQLVRWRDAAAHAGR